MPPAKSKLKLSGTCAAVYSPSTPIDRLKLFAGRTEQVRRVANAITTRGRHAMLYGERGVGKTSLAMVMKEVFDDIEELRVFKVNCVEGDTFESVWLRALSEIKIIHEPVMNGGERQIQEFTLDQYTNPDNELGAGDLSRLLRMASSPDFLLVLVFDEFDRLDPAHCAKFADTIKDLSDNLVSTTLVLVGLARDVHDLIVEHSSISRCLSQVAMPPMDRAELVEIIAKANELLEMTMDNEAVDLIVGLSQGLPHYTHLIAQESTFRAIDKGSQNVSIDHVRFGINLAMERVDHTLSSAYVKAAEGQRRGTLFPSVLLACALARVNELGEFRSTDVREALKVITGEEHSIPSFSPHLNKLSSQTSRGLVLEKSGGDRRFSFRFRNPLLRPFILMRGLADGKITEKIISEWGQENHDPEESGILWTKM